MNFTLTYLDSSSDLISIHPLWDFADDEIMFTANHQSLSGSLNRYFWDTRNEFTVSLRYVQNSDAYFFNEAWHNNERFIFQIDATSYSVVIANQERPFIDLESPYQDQFAGSLTLREQ